MRKLMLGLFLGILMFSVVLSVSAAEDTCNQDSDCGIDLTKDNTCVNSSHTVTGCGAIAGCIINYSSNPADYCKCENNKCVEKELDADCQNLYWFDNNNKVCGQKQFCGMYMYYGLQTFESKTLCLRAIEPLGDEDRCTTDSDCPQLDCEVTEDCEGIEVKCINGKCKEQKTCPNNSDSENNSCFKTLSNGRKAEIKIMPETASETAIARLGELGFTIELKEVGKETKDTSDDGVVYELTGNKQGKFLGIFKIMASERVQVDAETGEVKKVIKPWWSFLATRI